MTYSGATAASSVANPLRCVAGLGLVRPSGASTGLSTAPNSPGNQGGSIWFYSSTNKTTDINASNFFTDGKTLGMSPGDLVFGNWFTSAGSSVIGYMQVVTGVSTSGATLSRLAGITSTRASSA